MAKRARGKSKGEDSAHSSASANHAAQGGVPFHELGVRGQFRAFGAALARGFDIPPELMASVPALALRVLNQVDEKGKPLGKGKRRYTTREQLAAGRLAATIADFNLKAAVAELQGAVVARNLSREDEDGPVEGQTGMVVLHLPDNRRDKRRA